MSQKLEQKIKLIKELHKLSLNAKKELTCSKTNYNKQDPIQPNFLMN